MMTTNRLYAPTRALPAIAAALALSSTTAFAQEAQPTTTAPATTVQPAPDEPAPTTDTTTTAPATDTSTPATTTTANQSVKRTVRTTRISAAKPAPVATRTATRTVTNRAAAPAATATAAATPAPAPAAAPPVPQSAVAPVVPMNANPAPANTQPTKSMDNDTMEIAGGGALVLLALGGTAALLVGRRRRRKEQEWADEQTMANEPVEPATAPEPVLRHEEPAAASAFAWGNQPQADEPPRSSDAAADEDDRRPGESWVDRAYRGPSANNPSASLRNRLKRAAFFDKREREAAAGLAEPVDGSAGLPDAMVEEQERELA
jgi:hypothetical protein